MNDLGRRGPAPEPTAVKLAKGETRPSQINYDEPQPKLRLPVMPEDMDADAKAVWRRVMIDMGETEVIVSADTDVLRCYCEAVSRYVQAQNLYSHSSPLVNRSGALVKNPLHQVIRDNAEEVRLFARELGLSPSARSGLYIADATRGLSIDDDLGPPPRLRVVGGTYE